MSYFNFNKSFDQFVQDIRLSTQENSILSQKKINIEKKIKSHIQEQDVIITDIFTSGSYATKTAIQPVGVKKSYDIDFGIVLDFDEYKYTYKAIKRMVYKALEGFTNDIKWKEPCITATYAEGYSVDVAVYIRNNGALYLLRGKENDDIQPESADPKGLVKWFKAHTDDDKSRRQLRRIIRLLKYWAYNKFDEGGHSKPPSICLLVNAVMNYSYCQDDINVLYNIVSKISRHTCTLPVTPYSDILHKMTISQKNAFEEKLLSFKILLEEIQSSTDRNTVERKLQKIFGSTFPCEKIKLNYDTHQNAGICNSSASA